MRELFPGYYRPSKAEFDEMWKTALVAPDANVLLTLYRLSEPSRKQLLQIFTRLDSRLWMPNRVAFEFQRGRARVIDEQRRAYDLVEQELERFPERLRDQLRRHPQLDRDKLRERLTAALGPVADYVRDLRSQDAHPLTDEDVLGADTVRDELDEVFAGRIGETSKMLDAESAGKSRYEREIPPGYKDAKKPAPDRYADLAIWLELMDKAKAGSQDRARSWSRRCSRTPSNGSIPTALRAS